ncbi:MAG: hypothetical protein ACXVZ3_13160 [Gaiellaceae bacterium]
MSNFTALEVVIGLTFVYFVLSLVCSAVAETIASLQRTRAKMLVGAIENLLSSSDSVTEEGKALAQQFWAHPLVQSLIKPRSGASPDPAASQKDGKGPAYIPARTFVSALIDLGARNTPKAQAAAAAEHLNTVIVETKLLDAIEAIPSAPLRQSLLSIYRDVGEEAGAFRDAAEKWYDDSMDRVSGWYKRHIQALLWVIAILVVVFLNVDTLQIAQTLWKDPTTRAALVARADTAVQQGKQPAAVGNALSQLSLPLGWKLHFGNGSQEIPNHALGVLAKLIGLLLTAAALSLGAPFWFDLLSKFMRVRGTGPPPAPA